MEGYIKSLDPDVLELFKRSIATGGHIKNEDLGRLRPWLKEPFLRRKLEEGPTASALAELDDFVIRSPLPLELVVEHLHPSLKSLPQITGDFANT